MNEPTSLPLRSRSFAQRLEAPESVRIPGAHLGLVWRTLDREDLDDVVDLMSHVQDSPLGIAPASQRAISQWFDELNAQPQSSDILSGWDVQGKLQAVASVRVNDQPLSELQAEVAAVVRPEWVGRGIGRSLLEWQDDRARQLMALHPSDLPVSIRAIVGERNASRRRLLAAGGYTPITHVTQASASTMAAHVTMSEQARQRLAQRGYTIQAYTSDVDVELRRLHNRLILALERYQPMSAPAWRAKLARADYCYSFLLIKDHQLVGYTLAEQIPEISALRVYYYGIERALRREGVGTDLVLSVLGPAFEAGVASVSVPIVNKNGGIPSSLEDAGFVPVLREIVYSLDI
ncbi:GNAT family N-acetyltransferase [Arcanobacterium buesumense]|uniref:GNAT family N-acetyltransferase n=1 Tax=Arcanobacterium buesumense TaxID=2722751 RepID=A0A6H2EJE3_9ACTO|nr:GNAT family N-acetyltransferase [Arcanobacterium buesumense]QJC21685.1 GNAT family N-acetyltransferase [Arcanobacterium buesumense]